MARALATAGFLDLLLCKSEFKSAFRGCPIASRHLHLAVILVSDELGNFYTSQQLAMPFGAVSAVYAWDRLGAALSAILLEVFDIPCSRYVDDLFWVDFKSFAHHAGPLAMRVISLFGFTLEIDKTPEPSTSQEVLGTEVRLVGRENLQLSLTPDARKVASWSPPSKRPSPRTTSGSETQSSWQADSPSQPSQSGAD